MNCIFLILLSVSFQSKGLQVVGAANNYDEILSNLNYPDKLVFDVSHFRDEEQKGTDGFFQSREDLVKTGIRLSPILYYRPAEEKGYYNDAPGFISDWIKRQIPNMCKFIHHHTEALYFLVDDSSPTKDVFGNLSSASHVPLPNNSSSIGNRNLTAIFPHQKSEPLLGPQVRHQIAEKQGKIISLLRSQCPHIKIGLQYDYREYVEDSIRLSPGTFVDTVILNIDIPEMEIILSYSAFKDKLRNILNKANEILQNSANFSNQVSIYVKLNFPHGYGDVQDLSEVNIQVYKKYYYYLLQFSVTWLNEGHREGLILQGFTKSTSSEIGIDWAELWDILTIPISERTTTFQVGTCGKRARPFQLTSAALSRLDLERIMYVDECTVMENSFSCTNDSFSPEACTQTIQYLSIQPATWPDFHLRYQKITNDVNFNQPFIHIADLLKHLSWKGIETDLEWKDVDNAKLSSQVSPHGITIACTASSSFKNESNILTTSKEHMIKLTQMIYNECLYIWRVSQVIVWAIHIPSLDILPSELTLKLMTLEKCRQEFLKTFTEKKVMLRVNIGIDDDEGYAHVKNYYYMDGGRYGVYCSPSLLKMNTLGEIIINFAKLHNFPMEIIDVIGSFDQHRGGWKLLETVGELAIATRKFPVLVARNFPENFQLGDFHMDPCLTWTEEVSHGGILIQSEFIGTTLYMSGMRTEPLTPDELQTLLLFILHKFTLVEVVADNIGDLETLIHVLSQDEFTQKLTLPHINDADKIDPKLFLKVNWSFPSAQMWDLLYQLGNISLKPTGIHFPDPVYYLNKHHDLNFNKLQRQGLFLGLSLENCLHETNRNFTNIRHSQSLKHFGYIVCNVEHAIVASNVDRQTIGKYLDSTLFIKKYFENILINNNKSNRIELFFRLNSYPNQTISTTDYNKFHHSFLRFFSDVSQYARLYEMHFFMIAAFDDKWWKRHGWWEVSHFKDLTDESVFTEKEAYYLALPTWRPSSKVVVKDFSPVWENVIRGILITVVVLVNASLIAMIWLWYRRRFAILTRREVDAFRLGKRTYGLDLNLEGSLGNKMFPTEYEIAENRFVMLNIIGKGNFGLVYKATLSNPDGSGSTPVAVKLLQQGCSKDALKSILSEVKVLCFVGSHPHVIKFIGAYIAEVGRGKIYIATELCENGALLEHLRKIDREQTSVAESVEGNGDHYELIRFSHEIALGMQYIASRKIVHGDLSARNVLLDSHLQCRIADFGLSRILYQYQEYVKKTAEPLPWRWMAIESLRRMEFTEKSDVWSFGVTTWEIFSLGSIPYPGMSWTTGFVEDLETGLRMSAPKYASQEMYEQMLTIWSVNPSDRPSFNQLTPIFAGFRDKEYISI